MKKIVLVLVIVFSVMIFMPLIASAEDTLLNLKFYLIDKDSNSLPGYIVTIDNDHQAVADSHGVVSFPAVNTSGVDTFKVFTPDKKEVGVCNLRYVQGERTNVSDTEGDGTYDIIYDTPNSSIYIYIMANPKGNANTLCHPAAASDSPLAPGKAAPVPTPIPTTDPIIHGYLIDANKAPIVGATVKSKNDKTDKSLSATTDDKGAFRIPGISAGEHTIYAYDYNNNEIGEIDLMVKTGSKTALIKQDGEKELDISTGLGDLYLNIQADNQGELIVLDVSDKQLKSPATQQAPPTPVAQETPSLEPMPSGDPVIASVVPVVSAEVDVTQEPSAPTPEPEVTPEPEATPEPTPEPKAQGGVDMTIILIVAIVAVAAVVIAVIVAKRRR